MGVIIYGQHSIEERGYRLISRAIHSPLSAQVGFIGKARIKRKGEANPPPPIVTHGN